VCYIRKHQVIKLKQNEMITKLPLMLIIFGLLLLYIPTFVDLFSSIWQEEKQAHGPIVLMTALWFFYHKTKELPADMQITPAPVTGWVILIFGLLSYVIGRSQSFITLEVGSLIFVLLGLGLLFWGTKIATHFWFAFFLLCFMVPLPGPVVDIVTQPMKIAVSYAADQLLYMLNYPVARSGVIIQIGAHKLLIADACAGLNSLFTLEAMGLLYMNLIRHESFLRNALLALLIIPISFTANVIRVMTLALLTYYWGDAVGQGFLHKFSSLVLFLTALFLIMGLDSMLRLITIAWSKSNDK